ncbi:cytochrome c oxidase biogenesis cmc1 protein [Rutstroemia sp. NJR-2017a BVV2]|nr:cytochrome c oxidase biogenesis cmc1 protein [Rutstroemia sp. NJR-2017a BVV2]
MLTTLCAVSYTSNRLVSQLANVSFTACDEVMAALEECHARGFLWKCMGMCNSQKTAVNKCLRAQRLDRTAANREAAKLKREKVKAVWAEIDQNS